MVDRPAIFSGPMVCALLDGRKTQTRRLATSPLRRCKVGDRLWVREAWKTSALHDSAKPSKMAHDAPIYFTAHDSLWPVARYRPGMHMPRWASRLTLIVEEVRFQVLHEIDEADSKAEGVRDPYLGDSDPPFEEQACMVSCRMQYRNLWKTLHGKEGQRWDDNPQVVALTFRVMRGNIDKLEA